MDEHLVGTWDDFEAWIRTTIGSDFRWCMRPANSRENREMLGSMITDDARRNDGVFPKRNAFIERV